MGLAMFAAGIWVAAGGRGARFDRQEELFGGLFFAACGLLCIVGGFAIADRGRPQRHPRLRAAALAVESETVRRGDEVAVTATFGSRGDERLELGLACDERFDTELRVRAGGSTRQTGEAVVHEEWQAVPAGAGTHAARFRVPDHAPYSYEGDCVSYAWRVSVRMPRAGRRDARTDAPVWVEP